MAGITTTVENGVLKVYATLSFRDSDKNPQRTRKLLAKEDPNTNEIVFSDYFILILSQQGINIDTIKSIPYHDIPKYVDLESCISPNVSSEGRKVFMGSNEYLDYLLKNQKVDLVKPEITSILDDIPQNDNKDHIGILNGNRPALILPVKSYEHKNIGYKLILDSIIDKTGLLDNLSQIFPNNYLKIMTLASYLVSEKSSVMYCDDWIAKNESFINEKSKLASQRITELLDEIKFEEIMSFWDIWQNYRKENEYLALDITSISSYSNLISQLEFGYNRDGEKLPQINLCMLFGESSGLPVFSSFFNGSLNDSKILKSFLERLEFFGDYKYNLVMDKGFYSKSNILYMLKKYQKYNFMMAVPFTTSISKTILDEYQSKVLENKSFKLGNDTLMGYSFIKQLDNTDSVIYHVIFNETRHLDAKTCLKDKAIRLMEEAEKDPVKFMNEKEHKKYLLFNYDKLNNIYDISINLTRIAFEIRNAGLMIIVSNKLDTTYKEALFIYRNKDIVEKSFNRIKNCLSLKRLHVQSSRRMTSKIFIAMISLIISSYMNKIMADSGLETKYLTLERLLNKLDNITITRTSTATSISPITKELRIILEAFGIKIE